MNDSKQEVTYLQIFFFGWRRVGAGHENREAFVFVLCGQHAGLIIEKVQVHPPPMPKFPVVKRQRLTDKTDD